MATLHDLHEAIHGVLKPVTGSEWDPCATTLGPVVTDSRHVAPGDVYWGLVGPHHDGAEFTDEAFGRGAIGAVVGSLIQRPTIAGRSRSKTLKRPWNSGPPGIAGSVRARLSP